MSTRFAVVRRSPALAALSLALAGAFAPLPLFAQTPSIDALRQEMQQMRAQYEARLQEMERRLGAAEATVSSTAQRAADQASPAAAAAPAPTPAAGANAFNPGVSVILDGRFASFSKDPNTFRIPGFMRGEEANPGDRGFALGESEISLFANIDQNLFGNLTVAVERDGTVGIEEAYLQTTSLPYGFAAKAGRFFSGIGYLNSQHAHTWDFADAPLPYLAFLNKQFGDDGVQLKWLAPTDFLLEFGGEWGRGDAFPASGAADRGAGAYSAFVHAGDDLNESSSFRAGLSTLHTKARNRDNAGDIFTGTSRTGIADFVYKWAPGGNPANMNFKLQGEYFLRNEEGAFNALDYDGRQTGWYVQGVYQFMPRWRLGVRHDRVHASALSSDFTGTVLDNLGATPKRYSAMTDFSTSEFGRFRLQYNRDQLRTDVTDHQVLLQYTLSLGAHPAHQY